jgi:hypothetical protein
MRRTTCIALALLMAAPGLGCATMRRHPALTGVIAGAAIGTTVALATRHTCPSMYDGKPYQGTPPCPK